MYFEKLILSTPRIVTCLLLIMLSGGLIFCLAGCKAVNAIANDLDGKALTGKASVQIIKMRSSDAISNGAPTGEVASIIGNLHSVPVVAKKGETLKDHCELTIETIPGLFDFTSPTKRLTFAFTSDSSVEFQKIFDKSIQQMAVIVTGGSASSSVTSKVVDAVTQAAVTAATK